jgi:hypothetical protein
MATRVPLILNTSATQIQELAVGDTLDLSNCDVTGATNITTASATVTGNLTVNGTITGSGLVRNMILAGIIGI